MSLPKLTEVEYKEMKEDFINIYEDYIWFMEISANFFDNMYGNIYEEYIEYNKYAEVEEEVEEEEVEEEEDEE